MVTVLNTFLPTHNYRVCIEHILYSTKVIKVIKSLLLSFTPGGDHQMFHILCNSLQPHAYLQGDTRQLSSLYQLHKQETSNRDKVQTEGPEEYSERHDKSEIARGALQKTDTDSRHRPPTGNLNQISTGNGLGLLVPNKIYPM